MRSRKCVLMDLDGSTLVGDEAVAETLTHLIQRNPSLHWVMVTGRSHASASATGFGKLLAGDGPHVFDGGALVASLSGKVFYCEAMAKSDIERIHAILYSDFWDYVFGSSGTSPGLTCCKDPSIKPPQASKATHNLSTFLHWTLSDSIQKISISGMDISDIYKQINHFTNGTIVDFLAPGISKASGVKNILTQYRYTFAVWSA